MTYATPFIDLFRPLLPSESKALTESIKSRGVLQAVILYESDKHGTSIIDGVNRWSIASELKADCPVDNRGRMSDEEARAIAEEVNEGRRHLSQEEIKARHDQRRAKVVELRESGKSFNAIAEELEIDSKQAKRDFEKAQNDAKSTGDSVPSSPKVSTGKDGKKRDAKKPKKEPPAGVPEAENPTPKPQILSTPKGEIAIDAFGRAIPNGIGDYFGDETWPNVISDIENLITCVESTTESIENATKRPWLWIPGKTIIDKFKEIRNLMVKQADAIRVGLPHALCGHCEGRKCKNCRHTGYVPKSETDAEPGLYAGHAREKKKSA